MSTSAPAHRHHAPSEVPSIGFEEFERRGLEGAFNAAVKGRLLVLGVICAFAAWMFIADPALWRRILLVLIVTGLVVGESFTTRRFRQHGVQLSSIRLNLSCMAAMQLSAIVATGGLLSPVLPAMLVSAFIAGLLADAWGVRRLVWTLQIPSLALLTVIQATDRVPTLVPVPLRDPGNPNVVRLVLVGVVASMLVMGFSLLGSRLRREARSNLEHLQSAQLAALEVHRQRARDLTLMSGEIAHELKNPLASVKGLAQLLSRNAGDPKTTERLAVLSREVSRMQGILDEFLNFSRPPTPLTSSRMNLRTIFSDAVLLHEAMAASASARLRADVDTNLELEGDARKVGQVIANLLQNGLEVAPPDTEVELSGSREGERVVIEVRDRGPGLPPGGDVDLFSPGVTTKPAGSGLGLTISRAIAQQHGGTLALHNRPGGGCVARLVLPQRSTAQ